MRLGETAGGELVDGRVSNTAVAWIAQRLRSGESRIERPPPFTRRQARRVFGVAAVLVAAAVVRSVLGG